MSRNTHVTAADIPASSESQHPPLSHPYDSQDSWNEVPHPNSFQTPSHRQRTQVPNNTRLFQSQSVLLFHVYVLVPLCSVIVLLLFPISDLLSCQFVQEYSSHLLLCLIVFSFLLTLDSQ